MPAGLCWAGYQAPQDVVLRGTRLCRTSICYKMYTTLSLFCGVWYPARLSSTGSDSRQDLTLVTIMTASAFSVCTLIIGSEFVGSSAYAITYCAIQMCVIAQYLSVFRRIWSGEKVPLLRWGKWYFSLVRADNMYVQYIRIHTFYVLIYFS
jgi:hypothetical protein